MMMFLAGLTFGLCVGHIFSPWIDGKMVDLRERFDPDPSDDRNADRNRWE